MTRTERASFPRAVMKDRAESRTGMDKSTPKGGAGSHNWGSYDDERELEEGAERDEAREREEAGVRKPSPPAPERQTPSTSPVSEVDRQKARQFRKGALKSEGLDLAAIARTSSAVSTSPPTKTIVVNGADAGVKVN